MRPRPRSPGRLLFLLVSCLSVAGGTAAKDAVRAGDRVRVRAPELVRSLAPSVLDEETLGPFATRRVIVGTVTGFEPGVLVLRVNDREVLVPAEAVERIDVWSQGDYARDFAWAGAVGGAFIGGLVAQSEDCPPADSTFSLCSESAYVVGGVVLGMVVGGALGALIGSNVPRDEWTEARAPVVRVDPAGSVTLAFRF